MLIKALIATLVVSSSALAALVPAGADAAPAPVHALLAAQHVECAPVVPEWTVLSANDRIANQRTDVRIDSWTRYSELKLVANGRTTVDKINIRFENGQEQHVTLDKALDTRNPSLTIPLQGGARQIKSVEVWGASGHRSSFEILAA